MSKKSDVESFVKDAFAAGIFGVLLVFVIALIAIFLPAAIFVWLWNFALVGLFAGIPALTYWQGFAILIVAGMLFGRRG